MISVAPSALPSGFTGGEEAPGNESSCLLSQLPLAMLSLALSSLGRKLLLSRVLVILGLQPQEGWP